MKKFAVLQLSGCAGCEMSLLESDDWTQHYELTHLPLVISSHDIPEVEVLLISGGVRTDEDLFKRRSVKKTKQVVAVGTCAISGGVASLGDREEVRELFAAEESRREVPRLLPKCHPFDTFVNVDFYLPGCQKTAHRHARENLLSAQERHNGRHNNCHPPEHKDRQVTGHYSQFSVQQEHPDQSRPAGTRPLREGSRQERLAVGGGIG